jgi:hypothetical protein
LAHASSSNIHIWDFMWLTIGFILREFLIQRDKGKMRIKNYMGDYQEFRDFLWKFYNFWTSGVIRIKLDKKKRLIKGWDSIRDLSGCNLGTETLLGANRGSQACIYRIREEREGVTWKHLIGPPQHVSATWQHSIGPPHPYGSTSLGHISNC